MTNYDKWQLYTEDLESPDIFIRWAWVHLIASALQRRVWMNADEQTELPYHNSIFCNNYPILIGPPSTGKGRAIRQVLSVINHPLMTTVDKDGRIDTLIKTSPSKVTCERIIESIAKSIRPAVFKARNGETRTTAHCSCSFNIEELEVLFSSHMADMVMVLNDLYDAGNLSYETKNQGSQNIKNVCVNMLSGTTPNSIRDLLSNRVVSKGFTSRIIAVYADAPRFKRLPRKLRTDQLEAYSEIVQHAKRIASEVVGEVTLSEEASEWLKNHYESGAMHRNRVNRSPRLDDYYGRRMIHTLKVATSLHFAEPRDGMVVSLETVKEADSTLAATEANMHLAYSNAGRNVLHEASIDITRFLSEQPETTITTFKRLQLQFNNDLKKDELAEVLEMLIDTGQVVNLNPTTALVTAGTFRTKRKDEKSTPTPTSPAPVISTSVTGANPTQPQTSTTVT